MSGSLNVEVTAADYRRTTNTSSPSLNARPPRNLSSRLNSLLHLKGKPSNANAYSDRATSDRSDVESVMGITTIGDTSVDQTVASTVTVKVSNRKFRMPQPQPTPEQTHVDSDHPKKNPWRKLKKMMSIKKDDHGELHLEESPFQTNRSRSLSNPSVRESTVASAYPMRKRVESDQARTVAAVRNDVNQSSDLDDAIRGRFDGMDVLSLGSARLASVLRTPDPLTRNSRMLRGRDMVQDMLRMSGGQEPPELVLEGFIANDRWLITLNNLPSTEQHVPQLQSTDDDESCNNDGSPNLPPHMLLAAIWGRNQTPPPSHAPPDEYDDVFQMAASCSVPIDIDEETFIIDTPAHLQAVHDIASIPLKAGRFDEAIDIFKKILKGLEMKYGDEPHHVIGTTLHNIGVLQLWQERYQEAWESLNQAVSVRILSLSKDHPDIAVSLCREAMALFALEKWNDALHSLEKALKMSPTENVTCAKIWNNIGVVHYQRRKPHEALQALTKALEIQRAWLDDKVRRAGLVFDASVTMGNMGKLYLDQENYPLSFFVNEEALLLQTTTFSKDSDLVLRSLDSIAYTRAREGDYEKALQIYRGILRSQDARHGPSSTESMETTKLMGILYTKLDRYDESHDCFKTLLKWQRAHLRDGDPDLLRTKECLKMIESNLGGAVSEWI